MRICFYTRLNYSYSFCVFLLVKKGYGVLPGAPASFRVSNINPTFALLRWDAPKTLGKETLLMIINLTF